MTEKLSAGKEVLSYCGKCKLSLWHTIIAMKGTAIDTCECNTCKATHKYRDPSKKQSPAKKKTSSSTGKASSKAIPIGEHWRAVMNEATGTTKTYSMKETFNLGDIVDHPKFGKGVVSELFGENKMHVVFQDDIKTLMCVHS